MHAVFALPSIAILRRMRIEWNAMGLQHAHHVPAAESCLGMNLMPGWVVHDIPHGHVVLGLEDLHDLVAGLGHFDVDRLFLSSEGHDGATRKNKRRPGGNDPRLDALEEYVPNCLKRPLIWTT